MGFDGAKHHGQRRQGHSLPDPTDPGGHSLSSVITELTGKNQGTIRKQISIGIFMAHFAKVLTNLPQVLLYWHRHLNHYNNVYSFLHEVIMEVFLMGL